MKSLLCALPLLLTSCVLTQYSTPTTPVEMKISGSPTILPWGPRIYVDDLYRGNPIDGRFRIYLPDGVHTIRIQYIETLWEGDIGVGGTSGVQIFTFNYGDEVQAAELLETDGQPANDRP